MNIPSQDIARFLLIETLRQKPALSQKELARMLNSRLEESGYVITGSRARRIALLSPEINARIFTRKGKVPKKCPACEGKLRRVYSKNLKGRKILSSLSCTRCVYLGKTNKWIPSRYEFRI